VGVANAIKNSITRVLNARLTRAKPMLSSSSPGYLTSEWIRSGNCLAKKQLINTSISECEVNSIYNGILWTLSNDCVGACPHPLALMDGPSYIVDKLADAIEDQFVEWAIHNEIGSSLREMRFKAAQTGIAVGIPFKTARDREYAVKVGLQVVGAEYLTNPPITDNPLIQDGIEYWSNGQIRAVYILEDDKMHPTRYSAKDVIIWSRKRLHHLWPECAPAFEIYPSIRRHITNMMRANEFHSSIPLFLKLDQSWPKVSSGQLPDMKGFKYQPGQVPLLPPGTELEAVNIPGLAEDRRANSNMLVSTASRCINMPEPIAIMYSGNSNMATAYGDRQLWSYEVNIDRFDFERTVRFVFYKWYEIASKSDSVLPESARFYPKPSVSFNYSVLFEHPDPSKRAAAHTQNIASGASTITRIYADQSRSARREIQKECKLLGISTREWFDSRILQQQNEVSNANSQNQDQQDQTKQRSKQRT